MNVKISKGNSKMGRIPSVSLPAILTCRHDCECNKKCYAKKIERLRPNVRKSYQINYDILINDPNTYWREVEAAIMMSRFFRFHVSGDIPDYEYFRHMVRVSEMNTHCEILCFTKKFNIVNEWIDLNGDLPSNLHVIYSGWRNFEMVNPHGLPEAHVRYKDGTTTAREDAIECSGNCTNCAMTEGGCWSLKPGMQVVFDEH